MNETIVKLDLPMVSRAISALDGEEDPDSILIFIRNAQAELDRMRQASRPSDDSLQLLCLGMFLVKLEQALTPGGDTRLELKLETRRGRPRQRVTDKRRGFLAAYKVRSLVARGVKQESAIEEVGSESGLSRTELFRWLRRHRALLSDELLGFGTE